MLASDCRDGRRRSVSALRARAQVWDQFSLELWVFLERRTAHFEQRRVCRCVFFSLVLIF